MTDIIVPTSPKDLDKINKVMRDIVNSKTREAGEKEYQKETFKALEEEFGIKAKWFRQMANDAYKDQFDKKIDEMDDYSQLYESVMKRSTSEEEEEDE